MRSIRFTIALEWGKDEPEERDSEVYSQVETDKTPARRRVGFEVPDEDD